jgi:hypothetical protein
LIARDLVILIDRVGVHVGLEKSCQLVEPWLGAGELFLVDLALAHLLLGGRPSPTLRIGSDGGHDDIQSVCMIKRRNHPSRSIVLKLKYGVARFPAPRRDGCVRRGGEATFGGVRS